MKQTVKTSRAAGQLEKMFRELNKHYFGGQLPEPMASVCAIFSGAALSFQNTRMHTRRNSTDLQIMAGSTLLTIPLNSILAIEKLTFPDIKTVEYEITTTEGNTITIDTF